MITVCIPTLRRYDTLQKCIESLDKSTVRPDKICVIDNGTNLKPFGAPFEIDLVIPSRNIGVAASWNWFINNVKEIRVICNDDVEFYPDTLERLLENYQPDRVAYPFGNGITNAFSCFVVPDMVVKQVGYFDESISPGYAYFEDNDYVRRMSFAGIRLHAVKDCYVGHVGSATLKSFTYAEMEEHHKRFRLAEQNYVKKWGGRPGAEVYITPYNK